MKILAVAFTLLTLLTAGQIPKENSKSDTEGIEFFKGSWEEALAEAKKQNKPIFVDAYAVWCGPCKWMSAKVFPKSNVGEFYNKNFINYKYDMETPSGRRFAQKFQVRAYPTLVYLDAEGNKIMKVSGAVDDNQFIELGKEALGKLPK